MKKNYSFKLDRTSQLLHGNRPYFFLKKITNKLTGLNTEIPFLPLHYLCEFGINQGRFFEWRTANQQTQTGSSVPF